MHTRSSELQMQSHSNELENRLTVGEVERIHIELTLEAHNKRITFLERMLQGLIYAIGALATGKSGDLVDILLSLLKAKT